MSTPHTILTLVSVLAITDLAVAQETTRVSVDSAGTEGNSYSDNYATLQSISADNTIVAFSSGASNLVLGDTNGKYDVFVHDLTTGLTERVSVDSSGTEGNGDSWKATLSADGRFVAFVSYASNLVAGDTNGYPDVFVHDRSTGMTECVSVDSSGAVGNAGSGSESCPLGISADGQFVAFTGGASNLVSGDSNGTWDARSDRSAGTWSA
jgi:Tol biopolymer transport system component